MPNYDFQCQVCGHVFEKQVPLKDFNKLQVCPNDPDGENGHVVIRAHIKAPGQNFRGGGWTPKSHRS